MVVEGQSLGPHVFLIDMSSPGISRTCMGQKTTFNSLDNARVSFNRVRLPADALLSKLCSVVPQRCGDGGWRAEYTFVGKRPPSFVVIAQRLLSGRICISDSAIAYLEGVLQVTKKYAATRQVWIDKARKMPLSELPYMEKVLSNVEHGLNVHKAFLLLLQTRFAEAIESGQEPCRDLVTQIAAAKVESVEFAIKSLALLRRDVGSFSLMASSPFGSNNDVLLCCRFAEGDSRVLQQMLTRDLVRAHSKPAALAGLVWRVLKAWVSGAPHSTRKLSYLRDQQLLHLLWVLRKEVRQSSRPGQSKTQAETDAWLQAGDLVYDVAKTHAQQLIHSTVEEEFGRSEETDQFLDVSLSDCQARHVY
jgi:acyl-CoA oxidase